jgi:hypothetical protein
MMSTPAPPEDQARLLEDALIAVRQQTALMRKCLDTPGKLMDALKCWYVQFLLSVASYDRSSPRESHWTCANPDPDPQLDTCL